MSQHLHVHLSTEQRQHLETMIRSGQGLARTLGKARILLLADRSQGQSRTQKEVAEATLVCVLSVSRVCRQFVQEGLESALFDKPRPGATPKITGDIEAKLITLVCSTPPDGRSRWTLRLLADQMVQLSYIDSISNVAIYQTLKKTNLSLCR